jgi:hypothetical protein
MKTRYNGVNFRSRLWRGDVIGAVRAVETADPVNQNDEV